MLKSVGAVVVGFLTVLILSVVTDAILEKTGVFPPPDQGLYIAWMLVLATIYRTAFTVLGGYVTARLAPNRPMRHVMVLAFIGLAASLIALVTTWNKNLGPHWYPIALFVLAYPSVWYGGKLRKQTIVQSVD